VLYAHTSANAIIQYMDSLKNSPNQTVISIFIIKQHNNKEIRGKIINRHTSTLSTKHEVPRALDLFLCSVKDTRATTSQLRPSNHIFSKVELIRYSETIPLEDSFCNGLCSSIERAKGMEGCADFWTNLYIAAFHSTSRTIP
jgi:hypothetical protein